MASLSSSGLDPISAAMAGSEVDITVESMFSMNSATATISGTRRSRVMGHGSWVTGHGHRSRVMVLWGSLGVGSDHMFVAGAGRGRRRIELITAGQSPAGKLAGNA